MKRALLAWACLPLLLPAPMASADAAIAGHVLVSFEAQIPADLNATLSRYGATLLHVDDRLDFVRIFAPDITAVIEAFHERTDVSAAYQEGSGTTAATNHFCSLTPSSAIAPCAFQCNLPLPGTSTPNDPYFAGECRGVASQWGLREIHAADAWAVTTGNAQTIVAVVDFGVAPHAELVNRVVGANGVMGFNAIDPLADATDEYGHGTFIAGIIAAQTGNGVGMAGISRTRVLPIKACELDATGSPRCYPYAVASGIAEAAALGASVISLSLWTPEPTPPPPNREIPAREGDVVHRAIQFANASGSLVIAAAGNRARDGVLYPAAFPEVMAVSAIGPNGEFASQYSTYGTKIELAAPGGFGVNETGVLSILPGESYGFSRGTSFAAPHVAAVASLLKAQHPTWGPAELRARLTSSARPAGDPLYYGHGILAADLAVAS